jgi:hypothetical protein
MQKFWIYFNGSTWQPVALVDFCIISNVNRFSRLSYHLPDQIPPPVRLALRIPTVTGMIWLNQETIMLIKPKQRASMKAPFPDFCDFWCSRSMAGILRPCPSFDIFIT